MNAISTSIPVIDGGAAAVARLSRLASLGATELDASDVAALRQAMATTTRHYASRRELLVEGGPVPEALIVLAGWAAHVRTLSDGRRQIMGLLLPGEMVGLCRQRRPLAVSTVVALTPVDLCAAPRREDGSALEEAYAIDHAMEAAQRFTHITRLGRLSAHERLGNFLLELHDRLSLAGLAAGGRFALPITQELIAEATGLTSVHVNRMLQAMRRAGTLTLQAGHVAISDPAALAAEVDFAPVRVVAERGR